MSRVRKKTRSSHVQRQRSAALPLANTFGSLTVLAASGRRGRAGKGAELVTTDEEGTGAETGDENAAPAPPRPKPRPKRRATRGARPGTDTEGQASDGELAPLAVSTPKPRPRPKRAARKKATPESLSPLTPSPEPEGALPQDEPPEAEPQDDARTPRASRKRRRGDEEEANESGRSPSRLSEVPDEPEATQPNPSQETQADEIQIKRKRIRH